MDGEQGGGLASSLTDLMTSLALIFVFLLVAQMHNTGQESESARERVRGRLADHIRRTKLPGVTLENDRHDPLTLLMVLPEELMGFQYGKADIPAPGKHVVRDLAEVLGLTLCDPGLRPVVASVVVEGHTDPRGGDRFNIGLSQERARSVAMEMLPSLNGSDAASTHSFDCVIDLLSATGRGQRDPIVVPAMTEADHARNRRVVFKIRVKSSEQRRVTAGIPAAVPR